MSMHKSVRTIKDYVAFTTGTAAAAVLAVNNRREFALLQNNDAAIVITVSTDSDCVKGTALAAGDIYVHDGNGPIYAKAASGTPTLGVTEFVDGGTAVRSDSESTVALSTTKAMVLAQDDRRISAVLENDHGSIVITLGNKNVTAGAGINLAAGQFVRFVGQAELWAVAASGTPNLGISQVKR